MDVGTLLDHDNWAFPTTIVAMCDLATVTTREQQLQTQCHCKWMAWKTVMHEGKGPHGTTRW